MKASFLADHQNEKSHRRAHGDGFEMKAREYLLKNSYDLIAANVSYSFGEIDIVAETTEKGRRTLVFVEVRKRDSRSWLAPEETITFPKQRRLKLAIQRYLVRYLGRATEVRIDLIAFRNESLEHFPNFLRF